MENRFDKQAAKQGPRRRGEWVQTDYGPVYVREMTAAEWIPMAERSMRPAIDPRGGADFAEAMLWKVLLSCYTDETGSERLFDENAPDDLRIIYSLRQQDYLRIIEAIERVNGQDPEEAETLKAFFSERAEAPST